MAFEKLKITLKYISTLKPFEVMRRVDEILQSKGIFGIDLFTGSISETEFNLKRVSMNNNTGLPPDLKCEVTERDGASELKFEIRPNKLVYWALGVVSLFLLLVVSNASSRINGQESDLTERLLYSLGFLGLVVLIFAFLSYIGYRKAMSVLLEKLELRKKSS